MSGKEHYCTLGICEREVTLPEVWKIVVIVVFYPSGISISFVNEIVVLFLCSFFKIKNGIVFC